MNVGRRPGLADRLVLLAALAVSSLWCVTAAGRLGATYDEPLYVALGLDRWRTGSYWQILREGTMPLPSDVQTLPLYLAERMGGTPFDPAADLARLLPAARAATLVFWWLLLIYGWQASWELGGPWGARLAAALLASEPSLLAHAALATSDLAVAACLLALVVQFRRGRERPWGVRIGLPALWFGAAMLAKASGLVLGIVALVVVELERLVRRGHLGVSPAAAPAAWARATWTGLGPLRRDLVRIAGLGLALAFLYCGSDWRAEPSFVAWAQGRTDGPFRTEMVWVAEHLRIFRNAGEGLVRQARHNLLGHPTFLLGQVHRRAVWYYFPVVVSLKLTLTLLALPLLVGLHRPRALTNWAGVLAAVLLALSLTFRVQLGVRFVLASIVFAVVGMATAAVTVLGEIGPGWRRVLVAGLVAGTVWQAAAAVRVWPHGLAYANELWGGTAAGYRHVNDSNYDWGQGLPDLARWQHDRGLAELDIWYYGTDPAIVRLPMRQLGFDRDISGPDSVLALVRGRHLAVSTTLLYGRLRSDSQRRAAAFLRSRTPAARTTTFLIYDFTREPEGPAGIPVPAGHPTPSKHGDVTSENVLSWGPPARGDRHSMAEKAPPVSQQDLERVAGHALTLIPDRGAEGVRIGLGSGRAAAAFVRALGARARQGLVVRGVPTSNATAALAREVGIPVIELDGTPLELTVDGADEVAPNLDMIKGWGGALVRERIVAAASRRQIILVTPDKMVARLGARGRLPVEVIPFARPFCERRLLALGCSPEVRQEGGRPFVTDNGNLTLDCGIDPPDDPVAFERALRAIPGVVDTGLFLGTADTVLLAEAGAVRVIRRDGGRGST